MFLFKVHNYKPIFSSKLKVVVIGLIYKLKPQTGSLRWAFSFNTGNLGSIDLGRVLDTNMIIMCRTITVHVPHLFSKNTLFALQNLSYLQCRSPLNEFTFHNVHMKWAGKYTPDGTTRVIIQCLTFFLLRSDTQVSEDHSLPNHKYNSMHHKPHYLNFTMDPYNP